VDPADWTSPGLKRHGRGLWYGVLAGPVGWGVHLLVSYALTALTCDRGWPGFTLFGLSGGHVILLAFTLVVELLIVIAGITAHHEWSVLKRQAGWRGTGFARWMAFAGMVLSGFFFVAVLYAGLPALVLQSCL
jgi:hypothetical protein